MERWLTQEPQKFISGNAHRYVSDEEITFTGGGRHLGCSKEAYLDHFTRHETSFSTYTPNLVKISWSAEVYAPKKTIFESTPPGGRILLPVPTWRTPSFGDLYMSHDVNKLAKSSTRWPNYTDHYYSWPPHSSGPAENLDRTRGSADHL